MQLYVGAVCPVQRRCTEILYVNVLEQNVLLALYSMYNVYTDSGFHAASKSPRRAVCSNPPSLSHSISGRSYFTAARSPIWPVSYTHLDVYKRQVQS